MHGLVYLSKRLAYCHCRNNADLWLTAKSCPILAHYILNLAVHPKNVVVPGRLQDLRLPDASNNLWLCKAENGSQEQEMGLSSYFSMNSEIYSFLRTKWQKPCLSCMV